jgi:UDP-GlcNAc:undecaprenyl-phosphate GlcNAc-1-phosphate transferase
MSTLNFFIFSIVIFLLLYLSLPFAKLLNLLDKPSSRKLHSGNIPMTGGLAIAVYLLILTQCFIFYEPIEQIFIYSFLICIIGILDDKYHLKASTKLIFQAIPVLLLMFNSNIVLDNLGYYERIGLVNLGNFKTIFTFLCVIFLINAINYSDGIDGNTSLISISSFILIFFLSNDSQIKAIIIFITIAIAGFATFNLSLLKLPKIFLGDSGSMLIGFILSFFLIFLQNKKIVEAAALIWTINYFVFEFVATSLDRIIKKKKIFLPGIDHFHFFLKQRTKSNFLTIFIITLLNILFALIGLNIYKYFGSGISIISFVFFFTIFFLIRRKVSYN